MKRWWFITAFSILLIAGASLAEEGNESGDVSSEEVSPEEAKRRSVVLATIGSQELVIGDFEDRLNKQGPFRRVQYSAPEKRMEFLEQMVDWELQSQEAEQRGLGNDDAVEEQMKRVMSSLLLRRAVDDQVRPTDVTNEELQAYYEEHLSTFQRPERVRAYHIMVSDREKASGLLNRLLDEDMDTREFRRIAREMSEDSVTKRRGGDLRYFTRPEERQEEDPVIASEVVAATFELLGKRQSLQKRQAAKATKGKRPTSEVKGFNPVYPKLVKTDQGFHIIRFMGHREAVNRTFDDVERQIRNRIWREKLQKAREDFIEDLRTNHKVAIDEDNLELVKLSSAPAPGKRPSPLGSGIGPSKGPRLEKAVQGAKKLGSAPSKATE